MEIALVLGVPLCGGLLLALFGHKRWAPELNALMSFVTFAAAALLTSKVVADGPMTALEEQFFVDSFNVFLVALTAFVAFTTALFSRPYMRIEEHHGRVNPARLRLYHGMYQVFTFTMLLCLLANNVGVEVLHPLLGRNRAGPVRNDPLVFCFRENPRPRRHLAPVDASARGAGAA